MSENWTQFGLKITPEYGLRSSRSTADLLTVVSDA